MGRNRAGRIARARAAHAHRRAAAVHRVSDAARPGWGSRAICDSVGLHSRGQSNSTATPSSQPTAADRPQHGQVSQVIRSSATSASRPPLSPDSTGKPDEVVCSRVGFPEAPFCYPRVRPGNREQRRGRPPAPPLPTRGTRRTPRSGTRSRPAWHARHGGHSPSPPTGGVRGARGCPAARPRPGRGRRS